MFSYKRKTNPSKGEYFEVWTGAAFHGTIRYTPDAIPSWSGQHKDNTQFTASSKPKIAGMLVGHTASKRATS